MKETEEKKEEDDESLEQQKNKLEEERVNEKLISQSKTEQDQFILVI